MNRLGIGACGGSGRGTGWLSGGAVDAPGGAIGGALGTAGREGDDNTGADAGAGSFRKPGISGDPLPAPP